MGVNLPTRGDGSGCSVWVAAARGRMACVMHFRLPALCGTREVAAAVLMTRPQVVAGESAVLLCRDLLSGSASFADELVRRLLVEGEAEELVLAGAPSQFEAHVRERAAEHGVAEKVRQATAADV